MKVAHQVRQKKRARLILIFAFFIAAVLLFTFAFRTGKWDREEKLILVINRGGLGVAVVSFGPKVKEINSLIIPGETQVDVAGQLGKWKLKSVWQLGLNEKIGGGLLAKTIVKNFGFPVIGWADEPAYGFVGGGPKELFKAVFSSYKTNLTWGDRLKVGFFSLGVARDKKEIRNLAETAVLKKVKFIDGEEGYTIAGQVPGAVAADFIISEAFSGHLRARIVDRSEGGQITERVTRVLQTSGLKVTAISKSDGADIACRVFGKERKLVERLSFVFDCEVSSQDSGENFDIVIEVGRKFVEKF